MTHPNEPKKPHISPSAMDMYFRCGEQYRRRYVLQEKFPPGIALIKGGAVHDAAEKNNRQKISSHEDLSPKELGEIAAAAVDTRIAGEGLMLDEPSQNPKNVRDQLVDSSTKLAHAYHRLIAKDIQPVMVEQYVRIELPNRSHDLLGKLDVVDENDAVRDMKVGGKRKTQTEVDRSDQLTFYDIAFERETGRKSSGVMLDVLVEQVRGIVGQQLVAQRTPKDRTAFRNRLNAMLAGIKAGSFQPAPLGAWCCSPRFCGYWFTCPYVNSERTAAAHANEGEMP